MMTSDLTAFHILIKPFLKLFLIFEVSFSDVVSFSASATNSCRFPLFFALRVLFLNCFITDSDSKFSDFIKNEFIKSLVFSAVQNPHSTISEFAWPVSGN